LIFLIAVRKMYEEPCNTVLMKNKNVTTLSYKRYLTILNVRVAKKKTNILKIMKIIIEL